MVPDGVVAGVPIGEGVALAPAGERVEFGQPGEVAGDPGGVGAPSVCRQRRGREVRPVALEPVRECLVEGSYIGAHRVLTDRHPTHPCYQHQLPVVSVPRSARYR